MKKIKDDEDKDDEDKARKEAWRKKEGKQTVTVIRTRKAAIDVGLVVDVRCVRRT